MIDENCISLFSLMKFFNWIWIVRWLNVWVRKKCVRISVLRKFGLFEGYVLS